MDMRLQEMSTMHNLKDCMVYSSTFKINVLFIKQEGLFTFLNDSLRN